MEELEEDFTILSNSLSVLRWQRLWPDPGHVSNPGKIFYFRAAFLYAGIVGILYFLLILHYAVALETRKEIPLYEDEMFIIGMTGCYIILVLFVIKIKPYSGLLTQLSDRESFGVPPNFVELDSKLNLYSRILSFYVCLSVLFYGFAAYLSDSACREINDEKGYHEICGVTIPMWSPPFNTDYFPTRQLILIWNAFMIFSMMRTGCIASFTCFELVEHIISRIEHFTTLLESMFDSEDEQIQRKSLNNCIRYHCFILSLIDQLNHCFQLTLGAYVIIIPMLLCLIANTLVQGFKFGAFLFLFGCSMVLFSLCHAGQRLLSQGDTIAVAAYNSRWYEVRVSLQKDLLFLIMRAQRPMNLNTFPLGVMCYPLFVSLLKASYSYLALLNT